MQPTGSTLRWLLLCVASGAAACGGSTAELDAGGDLAMVDRGPGSTEVGDDLRSPGDAASFDAATVDAVAVDAAPPGAAAAPRALGAATGATSVTCPASTDLPTGAVCTQLTVQCPSVEDIDVIVAVTTPAAGSGATVVLHDGEDGTSFFGHGGVAAALVAKGLQTVQLAWASPWEVSTTAHSLLAAACRPATLFHWAFTQPHAQSRATGMCALGHSAGSAAIGYALGHYGLGETLDFTMLSAGPPFGRIDYGCSPSSYTGASITECPGQATPISMAPIAYAGFAIPLVNSAEGTHTCGDASASDVDRARWAADSVVSPGAVYAYPKTPMSFWYCGNHPNETTGLGWFYQSAITSTKTVHCVAGSCNGEKVYLDPPTFDAMVQTMSDDCTPRH